jgi:hypothetical protein
MYKTEGNKSRKKPRFYLLMQSKSFEKAIQMCELPYIQAGHGTQLPKLGH